MKLRLQRVSLVAALSGGLFLWGLASIRPVDTALPVILLGLGAVLLEVLAVRLPGGGSASAAFACYLALALYSEWGFGCATVALAGGVALRLLAAQQRTGPTSVLVDMAPSLLAFVTVHVLLHPKLAGIGVPWWVAALAAVLQNLWTRTRAREALASEAGEQPRREVEGLYHRLVLLEVASGFTGVLLYLVAQLNPWQLLWAIPVLGALQRATSLAVERFDVEEREALSDQVLDGRFALQQTRYNLQGVQDELRREQLHYQILQDLAQTLMGNPEQHQVLKTVVAMVDRLVKCNSVAVFLPRDGHLTPVGFRSPHAEKLQDSLLLKATEPLVEAALRSGSFRQRSNLATDESRLFGGEATAVALPLGNLGALYAGRINPGGFNDEELHILGLVAGQAALALQSARRYEAQKQTSEMHAAVRAELQDWAHSAEQLVRGVGEMTTVLDAQQILAQIASTVTQMLPGSEAAVVTVGDPPHRVGELAEQSGAALDSVVAAVLERGHPLLYEDMTNSRFKPLFQGQRSLLAAPVQSDKDPLGVVVAASKAVGAYSRRDQDLLSLLAYQAASNLEKSRLHAQTVEAYQKLQESQSQLLQSSKMTAVGQMAAGVAHELNTPLGAVMLGLDAALMSPNLDSQAGARLEAAVRELERAQTIVQNLLDFTRGVRRQGVEADLNQLLEETLDIIGYDLRKSGITLTKDLSSLPPLVCSPGEVQQVAINLLLNARDAVEGTATRNVRLSTRAEEGAVVFDVEDSGPGIPDSDLEHIFEPFFTTKSDGKGTGLGLSVSLSIVENHGGQLNVRSKPGHGTLFSVRLPLEGNQATRARGRFLPTTEAF